MSECDIIKDKLIDAGVKNMQEFGYQHCTKENILTDMIYSHLFLSMLKDQGDQPSTVQSAIDELITIVSKDKENI